MIMELPFEIGKVYITKMQTKNEFLLKEILWGVIQKEKVIIGFKGILLNRPHLGIVPIYGGDRLVPEMGEVEDEEPGMTGPIVDLFNKELTDEEWNALCVVHRMRLRLNLGIRFDWDKSIDVRNSSDSQIVDENVFLKRKKQ